MGMQSSVLPFVTAIALTFLRFLPRGKAPKPPYPPGPTGKNIPTYDPWVQYSDWGKEYGKLAYIRSQNILIINDLQVATDLLQSRAHIYSDRDPSFKPDLWHFHILDRFPWLRYMPSWIPGCTFKRITDQCLQGVREINAIPFDTAMNNLKSGIGTSLIAELATQNEGDQDEIDAIKVMGFSSSLGKPGQIRSFLLAMVMHPDVQTKGQEEIDRVIGMDRLPTFEDRRSLPYVESIYREVMRLHPPLPLGISHVSIKDDFYRGYLIPQGCIVIPNLWAINRDPDMYPEPDIFSPERFFNSHQGPFSSINDISAFGFGRRFVFVL
ncbi:hypothetical protein GYMLUDRAFT_257899 [Collybiopsis luxurians FD-317 M1]|nr:hypothetical protein GYMLUDRAFT_257899 [Collybiopsis luxurians FD-317 M1]